MQTRAFTHIDDVAPVVAGAIENPRALNQVFNVGADRPCTVRQLAELVQQAMGVNTGVQFLDARHEVVHAVSDHAKASELLHYRPAVELEDGLARMAAWVRRVGPRRSKAFVCIEIERELPASWSTADTR